MFAVPIACTLYGVQIVSLLVWFRGAFQLLRQQTKLQHAEWHAKAAQLFVGYVVLEFFRIVDGGFPDFETGIVYSVWGIAPWWVRVYSWVLRDILMFRGICVYLEHALVWSHSCMGWPVPRNLLSICKVLIYFGNVLFGVVGTIYMVQNDQFWQPVAAMGQIPPNIAVAIACYYLYRCLQKVPDCEESRHAIIVNISLLVAAFSCICVFVPWAVPRMLDMYNKKLSVHPTIPSGSSIFLTPSPSFIGAGERQLDLCLEMVECTVGWCGFVGLKLRSPQEPAPGEPLVLSSEEVGQLVASTGTKKKY